MQQTLELEDFSNNNSISMLAFPCWQQVLYKENRNQREHYLEENAKICTEGKGSTIFTQQFYQNSPTTFAT